MVVHSFNSLTGQAEAPRDFSEFKGILVFVASLRLAKLHGENLLKNKIKMKKTALNQMW